MLLNWDLNDIYTGFDSPQFQSDFMELDAAIGRMNEIAGRLGSFADVGTLVGELERYKTVIERIYAYAGFLFSANTANGDASKYLYKLESLNAESSRMEVRLAAFLAQLDKTGDIDKLSEEHGLGDYSHMFRHMVNQHAHMMTEDEETLAAKLVTTGSTAWDRLHEKLISTLTCDYADPKQDGSLRTIGINECRNLAYDSDVRVRKAAYEAELAAYPKIAESSAAAINGIKGEVNLLSRLRHYERPIDQTLFNSRMTQKTLDAMFEAIDDSISLFRGYLRTKADYLSRINGGNHDGLPFYDLFAPVGKVSDKAFTYDEAKAFVIDNFSKFSHNMAETAKRAFDNDWIDVYPREGKVSGAFCGHVYAIKQFRILLNYGGSVSDAITMAHELGHGYHSMNIMNERALNADYPAPLAETASTFCENVVTNAALAVLGDSERLFILENGLQGSTQVIVDIYSRYLFEKNVFMTRIDHPLSVEELNELMLNAQRDTYGDGLDPAFLHRYMWVIKSHYYSGHLSFYNFPYAFGHLLANGLYAIYESNPSVFGGKYDAFLRNTGKMPMKEVCSTMGIDVEDKGFWVDAINVIGRQIKEFERLTNLPSL